MRVLVLVDGEHLPSVTLWGIDMVHASGNEICGALWLGGTEKIGHGGVPDLGVPTITAGSSLHDSLSRAIEQTGPEAVLDLSDDPALGYGERMEIAAATIACGLCYLGSDFRLEPPIRGLPLKAPTLAIIGTGKRTGKTAIAGQVARLADEAGLDPVIVAMGRGGPRVPQIAERGSVTLESLLEMSRAGLHAASDYLEDALTAGVPTVGARRVGGGLAGAPFASNVREAAELADRLDPGLVILEGSGSAIPPVPWDACMLVVPVTTPVEYLGGYMGPYRLLISDLVVFTMGGRLEDARDNILALVSCVRRFGGDARHVVTDFDPLPLGDVRDKVVFFATTAPADIGSRQVIRLESEFGCRVAGWSHRLADRVGLEEDIESVPHFDVLLTEIKASAVDVACDLAMQRGAEVVFRRVVRQVTDVDIHSTLQTCLPLHEFFLRNFVTADKRTLRTIAPSSPD